MKLEVGMYVRTKEGNIEKISAIENTHIYTDEDYLSWYGNYNAFSKASHNIIDLIEVGDVIIDKEGNKYPINYEFEIDYNTEYQSYEITIDDHITLFFKDGLSIVTKEQFESMQYKVD